jgi:hypothetical protein
MFEDKRARSVEITPDAVTALQYDWNRFGVPVGLKTVRIRWSDIKKIGISGFVIYLDDGATQIAINSYLFSNPTEVMNVINSKASGGKEQV